MLASGAYSTIETLFIFSEKKKPLNRNSKKNCELQVGGIGSSVSLFFVFVFVLFSFHFLL